LSRHARGKFAVRVPHLPYDRTAARCDDRTLHEAPEGDPGKHHTDGAKRNAQQLTRGVPSDSDAFLWAVLLSVLTAAVWAAIDTSRAPGSRVLIRWVAMVVVVGGGLGIVFTLYAPGPPSQRTSDTLYPSLLFSVPLLAAVGLGVVIGMAAAAQHNRARRGNEVTSGTRSGH